MEGQIPEPKSLYHEKYRIKKQRKRKRKRKLTLETRDNALEKFYALNTDQNLKKK